MMKIPTKGMDVIINTHVSDIDPFFALSVRNQISMIMYI